jgi:hypothetical protein
MSEAAPEGRRAARVMELRNTVGTGKTVFNFEVGGAAMQPGATVLVLTFNLLCGSGCGTGDIVTLMSNEGSEMEFGEARGESAAKSLETPRSFLPMEPSRYHSLEDD